MPRRLPSSDSGRFLRLVYLVRSSDRPHTVSVSENVSRFDGFKAVLPHPLLRARPFGSLPLVRLCWLWVASHFDATLCSLLQGGFSSPWLFKFSTPHLPLRDRIGAFRVPPGSLSRPPVSDFGMMSGHPALLGTRLRGGWRDTLFTLPSFRSSTSWEGRSPFGALDPPSGVVSVRCSPFAATGR